MTTDGCLFGAWSAEKVVRNESGIVSQNSTPRYAMDIGTGTGLLSLMLAQKNPELIIDAIELDEDAAAQASENIHSSPWKDRINIINADARTYLFNKKYDIIISNPPFYEGEIKGKKLKRNIAHHNEGLLLRELLALIKNNLSATGVFYLLLPYKRNEEISSLLVQQGLIIMDMIVVKQSPAHTYFRILMSGMLPTNVTPPIEVNEIMISEKEGSYTRQFVSLLKDYYLQL